MFVVSQRPSSRKHQQSQAKEKEGLRIHSLCPASRRSLSSVLCPYRVYAIVTRPKQDDYWLNIGAAFPHDDGKGFNIILQAHPIGEKIVVRLRRGPIQKGMTRMCASCHRAALT